MSQATANPAVTENEIVQVDPSTVSSSGVDQPIVLPSSSSERLHALDAVRAFALLSGIVLHAAMSFLPGFADVGWPISDVSPSTPLAVMFFVIHQFRMLLFFFIAGFFGHLMFHRRGTKGFIVDRLWRISLPFVVGWILLMPAIVVTIILAVIQIPNYSPPPPKEPPFLAFSLTHLWFLYILQWLYLTVLIIRAAFDNVVDRSGSIRKGIDHAVSMLLSGPWGAIALAIPIATALYLQKDWDKWFGIPTPDQSLVPVPASFLAFLMSFGLGWIVHRQPSLLKTLERQWWLYLSLACAMTIISLSIAGIVPSFNPEPPSTTTLVYAMCYSAGAWFWSFALIGVGLKFFSTENPKLRYVADSSYWLYLVHLPVVFLAQAIVMRWSIHWSIKFPLILLTTVPLMLLSYHFLVRWTFIGQVLNGRKYPIFAKAA